MAAPQSRPADHYNIRGQKVRNSEIGAEVVHRRNASLLGQKYKPSEHAMAQYSPLRS